MVTAKHTYLRTHAISGKVLTFDLKADEDDLFHRARTGKAGRAAKTLVKEGPLRIALVALRKGISLKEHDVAGAVSVQVLRGRLALQAAPRQRDLRTRQLVVLDTGVAHAATALSDCAILITMAMQ
jgi:quercetin dioxygenase-like cupin family protein